MIATTALFAIVPAVVVLSAANNVPTTQPASRPASAPAIDWAKHYYDRVAQFKRENATLAPSKGPRIVMVGSSHIERFGTKPLLPGRNIVNRGISSDRIGIDERGILHRLDSSVFDCKPDVIILENGVNDLGELWRTGKPSLDEIDACYRKVVGNIRTRLPDVPLIIVNLFPARDRYAGLKPLINDFNQRLAKIAEDYHCPFMDMYKPLADDQGLLQAKYSRDGLHLSDAGYRIWADKIEKALDELDRSVNGRAATRPASDAAQ
jgi:lysophospholipase L1-like esterase